MRGRWTALSLPLALACSAAVLAGCGVSRTIDPVAAAAAKTENAGGVKVAMTVAVNADGKSFTVDANGAFDRTAGQLSVDLSSVLGAAGMSGGGSAQLRFLEESGDPVLYANVPFLSTQIPGGKSWIRLDLQQAGNAAGIDVNQLLGQAGQNPADVLALLRASGSVDEVGAETIDGVATTHYRATIDLHKALDQLGGRVQAMVQRLIDAGAPSTLPVDVWIGADGYVRQLTMDESVAAGGHSGEVKLTLALSDYGTAVDVTAPPPSDTLDLTALAAAALSHR